MSDGSGWSVLQIILILICSFLIITQLTTTIATYPDVPAPITDVIVGKVTKIYTEKRLLFNHYIVSVDNIYVFEVSLETYMKLSIGSEVRLDRTLTNGEWSIIKVTLINEGV